MTERNKSRRRWPWILAILALALVVVVVAASALIDVERFRGPLERALGESTGWQAELGEIELSLWPLAVAVTPVVLDDPQGESEIRVERLEVDASLRSLLGGELALDRVALERPRILAVRDATQPDWRLPLPVPTEGDAPARSGGPKLRVDRVDVRDGTILLRDRTREPVVELALEALAAELRLGAPSTFSAAIGDGSLEGRLDPAAGAIEIALTAIATESLELWLGPELIRPGGALDGGLTVTRVDDALRMQGDLVASSLLMLAGERALDRADLDFEVLLAGDGALDLDALTVVTGETRATGRGPLAPDLDVELVVEESPIESVVGAVRALMPFPLELRPPGRGSARARVEAPAGEALRYSAEGSISAAGFRAAEFLPEAESLAADFQLSRAGKLTVRLTDGTVGGGPLRGVARLDSVDPPGRLSFDGTLEGSPLGALVAGFAGAKAGAVKGPTAVETRLAVDLGSETLGIDALGGQLTLDAADVALPGWDVEAAVAARLEEKLGKYEEIVGTVDALLGGKLRKEREAAAAEAAEAGEKVERLLERLELEIDFDQRPWPLRRIAFRGDDFTASGTGSFDAASGAVALRLSATFSEERTARWSEGYDVLRPLIRDGRLTVPIRIDGPMTTPAIGVDLSALTDDALGGKSKEEQVKGLLRDLLKKR